MDESSGQKKLKIEYSEIEKKSLIASYQTSILNFRLSTLLTLLQNSTDNLQSNLWESMKLKIPFTESMPEKPRLESLPESPNSSDSKYIPNLKFWEYFIPRRRRKKIEESLLRYKSDRDMWLSKTQSIQAANKRLENQYDTSLQIWEDRRSSWNAQLQTYNENIELQKEAYSQLDSDIVRLGLDNATVVAYFDSVLNFSKYPVALPHKYELFFLNKHKILVINYEYPSIDVIPQVREIKYSHRRDVFKSINYKSSEIIKFYLETLRQITFKILNDLFSSDTANVCDYIKFTGWYGSYKETPQPNQAVKILSLKCIKKEFLKLNMKYVNTAPYLRKIRSSNILGFELSPTNCSYQKIFQISPVTENDQNIALHPLGSLKDSLAPFNIVPYFSLTPEKSSLSNEQYECYVRVKRFMKERYSINLSEGPGYLCLYIYDLMDSIVNGGVASVNNVLDQLKYLNREYSGVSKHVDAHMSEWIAATTLLTGDVKAALALYQAHLTSYGIGSGTHTANRVLNLKLKLGRPVSPLELLAISNWFTSFGRNNLEAIIFYMDVMLGEFEEQNGIDFLRHIAEKHGKQKIYGDQFFLALPMGHHLDEILKKQQIGVTNIICFYAIPEFMNYIKDTCREAENRMRKDRGIPRVGEGWVGETELFYKLKTHFSQHSVIQHYTSDWLENQHLDIYIPELFTAIEFQGEQHFKPVNRFGGEEAFRKTIQRDICKKLKCHANNVRLIYVTQGYDFSEIVQIVTDGTGLDSLASST